MLTFLLTLFLALQSQDKAVVVPEVISHTRLDYQVVNIFIQQKVNDKDWQINVWYTDNLGNEFLYTLTGDEAQPYVVALNSTNNATRSLQCRILDFLKAQDKIPSTAVICGG